ncbi:MAG: SpoIIE family protein phosphatase [Ignavibacteriaceae bacterium]|nr:SpoIIE family protein phosphatase [Ignavibacteriaceae bacterium]
MTYYTQFTRTYLKRFIILVTVILGVTAILNIYQNAFIITPSNDECIWYVSRLDDVDKKVYEGDMKKAGTHWGVFFTNVKEGGVAWNAGVRNGDQFLKLNDITVQSPFDAQNRLNAMSYGEFAKYTIKRDDKVFETHVFVKKLIMLPNLASSIAGFVWLILGMMVLLAKPEGKTHLMFFLIGALWVISDTQQAFLGNFLMREEMTPFEQYYTNFTLIANAGMSALFLHLFLVFPRQHPKVYRPIVIKLIYLTFILISVYTLVYWNKNIGLHKIVNLNPFAVLSIFNRFATVASFFFLFSSYRAVRNTPMRKPILLVLITSLIAGLSTVSMLVFQQFGIIYYNNPEIFLPSLLLILVPVAFAVAIFKYSLLDVSVVIKNTIFYGTASVILAVIYLLAVFGLGQSIGSFFGEEYRNIIAVITFVLFALVFQSTKDRFQEVLTRKFYPEQYYIEQILLKFSEEISNTVGLKNVIIAIKNIFEEKLGIRNVAVYLLNENDEFVLSGKDANNFYKLKFITKGKQFETNLLDYADIVKNKVITEHVFERFFSEDVQFFRESGFYTVAAMTVKGKVKGLICLGLKFSGSQFSGKELEILSSVGTQAAVAIENARLYNAENEKIQIEKELELARNIQQSLLPDKFPDNPKFEVFGKMVPAKHVGGDYFDIIKIDDQKFFVVIGDVSGKGLPAALYITRLQTMLQFYCTSLKSPREVLLEVNEKLFHTLDKNSFITAALCLIDLNENKLQICRAGHTPVLLRCDEGIKRILPKGLPLGFYKNELFGKHLEEETYDLKRGQLLFLYSDGVSEMMNHTNDLFGDAHLSDFLSASNGQAPSELFDRLWDTLVTFKGEEEQNDDVTAVIVKINQ